MKDLVTKDSLALFASGSKFTIGRVFLREHMDKDVATFELFIRELPPHRNYLVFMGLENVIKYLLNFKLTKANINYLSKYFHLSKEEVEYFKKIKFTGDVWAMPEGSIVFPGEPLIRITAPIIEAQLVEHFLINTVFLQTILGSKISRLWHAIGNKSAAVGSNRCYGMDAAMKAARALRMFGIPTSLVTYSFLNQEDVSFSVGTFHYLIMSFPDELSALRAYIKHTKGSGYILVDTYDTISGVKNFITAAKELEKEGIKATGIQLDSGDRYKLSVIARKMLDKAGLRYVKIFAMGNLDEYKIAELEKRKAPIDVYGGTTELLTPTDAPTIELVYKLTELVKKGVSIPKMKTSTNKISLPGKKQVFRIIKNRRYSHDVIGLCDEKSQGKKLLQQVIKHGKLFYKFPTVEAMGQYYRQEMKKFNKKLFDINKSSTYTVKISKKLQSLKRKTQKAINKV